MDRQNREEVFFKMYINHTSYNIKKIFLHCVLANTLLIHFIKRNVSPVFNVFYFILALGLHIQQMKFVLKK